MIKKNIRIQNKLGLHARASMRLLDCANRFASTIEIQFGKRTIDAKSIMDLLTLGAILGSEITLIVNGPDEDVAITTLTQLIDGKFGESE